MRLALYGGTFDPIHHGHLLLAREALEQLQLDRVIFIPARLSPHKLATTPTPAAVRREMLAAAIADEPGFALDDSELGSEGPSFTIDTVERVRAEYPEGPLYYLVGADNVRELHTWRRYEDLCRLVEFVVLGRGEINHPAGARFQRLERRVDISATDIRQRVARGQSIRYLVPEPVRSLIAGHHLYQDPNNQL
jgi:nicotinate-nucleotide adenylyltransferase